MLGFGYPRPAEQRSDSMAFDGEIGFVRREVELWSSDTDSIKHNTEKQSQFCAAIAEEVEVINDHLILARTLPSPFTVRSWIDESS